MQCFVETRHVKDSFISKSDDEFVFAAVQCWIKHDVENRQKHVTYLLKSLNFEDLPTSILRKALSDVVILGCPLILGKIAVVSLAKLEKLEQKSKQNRRW